MTAAILIFTLVGTAGAAPPVSKDGKIHACYRVKGKPKGSLRVVGAKKRCRRGERRVAWSAAGSSGVNGQAGTTGQAGSAGQSGSDGSNEAVLKTRITSLETRIDSLEGLLSGLLPDVETTMATLSGLDNGKLLGAVDVSEDLLSEDPTDALNGLPVVKSLCEGTETATEGVNELETGVKGLSVLGLPGLSLGLGSLPGALDPFSCTTP